MIQRLVPIQLLLALALGALAASPGLAATYYIDPAAGKLSNPGTAAQPWNTLEAVANARKPFKGGDVILLRNGDHGFPVIRGRNAQDVTIKPQPGHNPKLQRIQFREASRWVLAGIDISPMHAGANKPTAGKIVDIMDSADRITIKDCRIRSVFSVAGFSVTDWKKRVGAAVASRAPYTVVTGNQIENVGAGVYIEPAAHHSIVAYNVVDTLRDDGFRALSSDSKFEYNTLKNVYAIDGNHDDGLQSFTTGGNTIRNVEVRGNVFISYTDPKQPYKSEMQGIGCFDGMFENWVVENNVIVTDKWHGIAFYGARNCRIVNNTVVKNPINARNHVPWIMLTHHKKGTKSTGNTVRNNITSGLKQTSGTGTIDSNLVTSDYNAHFVNWAKFDLRLKSTSAAVNAGQAGLAPRVDANLKQRKAPFDLGALELGQGGTSVAQDTPPKSQSKPTTTKQPTSTASKTLKGAGDPRFSVGSGSYSSPRIVKLHSPTKGAIIRYTTDGSTPTPNRGKIYQRELRINRNMTIKAVAYKAGMKASSIKSATYRIKSGTTTAAASTSSAKASKGSSATFELDRARWAARGGKARIHRQGGASGGAMLVFEPKRKGDHIEFTTSSLKPGTYAVKLRLRQGPNRAKHRAYLDGRALGSPVDGFSGQFAFKEVNLGRVTVTKAAPQTLRLAVTGRHNKSKGFVIAADRVTFAAL